MRQIRNHYLAQLLMQQRFTPKRQRRKQLHAARKLLDIVSNNKDYPLEFISYKITGYRPGTPAAGQLVNGRRLADDLRIFITKLSGQVAPPVADQHEKIYTIEQLAQNFHISGRTILRWRKHGLVPLKYVFQDGKKRFGFPQSTVDKFTAENPEVLATANFFHRLSKKEKQDIIQRAAGLKTSSLSRQRIIRQIAAETNRAVETIRYTLIRHEKSRPRKHPLTRTNSPITAADAAKIYKLHKQGRTITELQKGFRRSRSSIYRIIKQRRTRALLARRIEFVTSDEFLRDDAGQRISGEPIRRLIASTQKPRPTRAAKLDPAGLAQYLEILSELKNTGIFNRQREVQLFRRYNYLKYLACIERAGISPAAVKSDRLDKIENYLDEAEIIKRNIIETNLPLVVSIAAKHAADAPGLLELVREGNRCLVRAVEQFDYSRGIRFATFASWSIAKDYARKIPAETSRPGKPSAAALRSFTAGKDDAGVLIERTRQSLINVIRDNLYPQEQYIILNHFGLVGSAIKKKTRSLKQLSRDLDLSKERVRHIELHALQKLRRYLSSEEFELLSH